MYSDEVSVAPGGQAEVRLPSAAVVKVSSATRFRIQDLDADEVVDLVRGSVALSVPKLQPAHALSVVTPDAQVVVHGTRFRVSVAEGLSAGTTETSVAVTEGEVAVVVPTGHVVLRTGQNWRSTEPLLISSASATPQGPAHATTSAEGPVQAPASVDRTIHSTAKPTAGVPAASQIAASQATIEALAEQNRLYRAAIAARHAGDDKGAVSLLSELLSRYPQSPLAAEARNERALALSRLTHDASR